MLRYLPFLFAFLFSIAHAGTMGEKSSFAGLFAGAGGGYVNTNLTKETSVTMFSSFSPVTQYFREDNIRESFAPIADIAYFRAVPSYEETYVGLKAIYKYLGIQHPRIAWSGTFQNGTYQEASLLTEVVQELLFTANAGMAIHDNWLVYLGVGPSITEVRTNMRGSLLPATSVTFQFNDITNDKWLWGVAGQVGFEYLMPRRFMLDLSYNLVVTPKGQIPSTYFQSDTSGFYTRFSQRVSILEQGLNITVNKFFD